MYIYLLSLFVAAQGVGEISFLRFPDGMKFSGNLLVRQSLVKDIYSASLGFTTTVNTDWNGLSVCDPFNLAEAVVCLVVDGVNTVGEVGTYHFPLDEDEDQDATWYALRHQVLQRYNNSTLIHIDFSRGGSSMELLNSLFDNIDVYPDSVMTKSLDLNTKEDYEFISEITLLNEIIRKVNEGVISKNGIPDVYWFVLHGLSAVVNSYGPLSASSQEARQLTRETINKMNEAFASAYNGDVIVSVIASNTRLEREIRSVNYGEPNTNDALVLRSQSSTCDGENPAMFHIILWTSIGFILVIFVITVGMLRIDPSKDSIIYRMSSCRGLKKEE